MSTLKLKPAAGQVPLAIPAERERYRNFKEGWRSFYFFDFDDNVAHLQTKIVIFHKITGKEIEVSTTDFPIVLKEIGVTGSEWEHFEVRDILENGSFRNFREMSKDNLNGKPQPLIHDMLEAMQNPHKEWRGPSWNFFAHAVNNNRPVAVITARGHHPHTIKRAVDLLVLSGDLDAHPNYLSVYPVSHPEIRKELGDHDMKLNTAELKKIAIKSAVSDAFACYGENPYHRFGMSDDDPHNVALIIEAMRDLKEDYPENAFFAFNTHGGKIVREEILLGGKTRQNISENEEDKDQMSLF